MPENFLKIVSFGLIGESKDGDIYRHVGFEEVSSGKKADYLVRKKKRPVLWADIEDMEKGRQLPPRKGYIIMHKGIDVVVLGDESVEDAFESQKWKLETRKRISFFEAEKMRKDSKGYCTNLTYEGAMEVGWRPIDNKAAKVKFRYYSGMGKFSWSGWFEITSS